MTSRVSHTTFDCRDAFELSEWWKGVLGYIDRFCIVRSDEERADTS
jgi:hypothetical protein